MKFADLIRIGPWKRLRFLQFEILIFKSFHSIKQIVKFLSYVFHAVFTTYSVNNGANFGR